MYTNGVFPYHRAPHILLGFPKRYIERENAPPWRLYPILKIGPFEQVPTLATVTP